MNTKEYRVFNGSNWKKNIKHKLTLVIKQGKFKSKTIYKQIPNFKSGDKTDVVSHSMRTSHANENFEDLTLENEKIANIWKTLGGFIGNLLERDSAFINMSVELFHRYPELDIKVYHNNFDITDKIKEWSIKYVDYYNER